MTQQELISKIENKIVINNIYGRGTISKVRINDNTIYFDIIFVANGVSINKTFSASIAVEKNVLKFDDEEVSSFYNELTHCLESNTIIKKVGNRAVENKTTSHYISISTLKEINGLINLFNKKESFTLQLIDNYENNEFEETLCDEGFKYLDKLIKGFYVNDDCQKEIIILLSYLALKYYDGDLHTKIFELFRKNRNVSRHDYTDNMIRNSMYKILGPYRNEVNYFHSKSYNAVPIIYASVPHYRISQLFKIAYDIYKNKLLFDDDLSNDQIESKVEECLKSLKRKDLLSDSDNIKGTEYLMSKYTQSCIYSGYNLNALISIISHCIRLIINHLTRSEDSFVVEPYYKEGFNLWIYDFDTNTKEKEKYEKNRLLSRPCFKLHNQKYIYLYTGEYCMDDSYNPQNVKIELYSNNELVKVYEVDGPNDVLFNDDVSMGGYIIKRQQCLIECSPIDKLSYKIICDGHEIYSSRDRLHRKVLFFDKNGNEVKPGNEYDGDIFVVSHSLDNNDEGGSNSSIVLEKENYYISIYEVNSRDVFRFDNEPYVFYRIKDSKLIGYQVPWASFTTMESKEEKIYKDISVLFQASCQKEEIYISVDNTIITFGEDNNISYRIYLFSNEYNGVFAYLIKIYGLTSGLHNIKIYNSRTKKLIKNSDFNFVYDDTLSKKYISKTNTSIFYEITSDFLNSPISFEYPYGTSKQDFNAFVKELGPGKLNIYPSTISYSVDGIIWHDIDWKFYLFELNLTLNSIYVCGPDNLIPYVIDENSIIRKRKINYIQNDIDPFKYEVNIEYLRTLKDVLCLKISFEYGTRNKYLKVWYKPYIKNESSIEYNRELRQIRANFIYEGNIKLWLILKATNSNVILHKIQISSGQLIEIDKNHLADCLDNVHYVTASLHMPSLGLSLFKKYDETPIKSFPKLCLDDITVRLKPTIFFNDVTSQIVVKSSFDGVEKLKIEVCPSGFDKKIYIGEVQNNSVINITINKGIFNSYTVLFYKPKMGGGFDEKAFYISKPIKTTSYFLKKKLIVKEFILDNKSKFQLNNHWIDFIRIEKLNDNFYMLGNIVGLNNRIILENIYIHPIEINTNDSIIQVFRVKDDKKFYLKLKNGLKIVNAVLIMK